MNWFGVTGGGQESEEGGDYFGIRLLYRWSFHPIYLIIINYVVVSLVLKEIWDEIGGDFEVVIGFYEWIYYLYLF